jgi:glycosyltransferase involved in cell wall biosynthesis
MTKGIQFWSHSYCRSTLAYYEELARVLDADFRVCITTPGMGGREQNGFSPDEFDHLEIVDVSTGGAAALQALDARADWYQLFGVYQVFPHIQAAIASAIDRGIPYGIASEAPCNMEQSKLRHVAKEVYLDHVIPRRLSRYIDHSDFIINLSGDSHAALTRIGWDPAKIIPCGYFPPPFAPGRWRARTAAELDDFHVLCSGAMTWHRGADVAMDALVLLKRWNLPVRATFTSGGPLRTQLQQRAVQAGLECAFPGLVSIDQLVDLYESCSVFVASGRAEPWGVRVNDALHCGAPIMVSRGMGAIKLVNDFGAGLTFAPDDPVDLAWQMRRLLTEPGLYADIAAQALLARDKVSPRAAAERTIATLKRDFARVFG